MKSKPFFSRFSHLLARCAALLIIASMARSSAQAAFHLWTIREIYTDGSGSYQFIEFFTPSGGQQFVGGQQVFVSNVGATQTHTFTIPSSFGPDSANHTFLIGTAGIQAAGAPAPDFIIPSNFLFAGGGSISFFGANSGSYTALPTDGSFSRTWGDGNALNSPQNFAGQTGLIVVPEPSTCALLITASAGCWFGLRRRSL